MPPQSLQDAPPGEWMMPKRELTFQRDGEWLAAESTSRLASAERTGGRRQPVMDDRANDGQRRGAWKRYKQIRRIALTQVLIATFSRWSGSREVRRRATMGDAAHSAQLGEVFAAVSSRIVLKPVNQL